MGLDLVELRPADLLESKVLDNDDLASGNSVTDSDLSKVEPVLKHLKE